ncbi:MAG: alpha/beta fold hydrolase [Chloroflexota bacterium]
MRLRSPAHAFQAQGTSSFATQVIGPEGLCSDPTRLQCRAMIDHKMLRGVRLSFMDTGGMRPILLLVHGFALDHRMWESQIDAFREEWRVIAPDLRGFGNSDAGPSGPLTMPGHADDLATLLSNLAVVGPVVYVGLSMGGYAGFELWRRHRERVRAMVLADTKATLDDAERQRYREIMARDAEAVGSSAPALEAMWPHLCSASLPPDAEVPQMLRVIMESQSAHGIADGQRGMAARQDSVPLLAAIDVPTMVIVGEDDVLTPPAESRLMAERLPRATLVEIPGAGHMSNMEAPEAFNAALLAFLRGL